jgi:hypothetical protein
MDFFVCFECVLAKFYLVITNLKFYKPCFIKDNLQQKHLCIKGWCLVRQRNPQARPYGFKNQSMKPMTVTRQLTKSPDFRQNYFCDFHLCLLRYGVLIFGV